MTSKNPPSRGEARSHPSDSPLTKTPQRKTELLSFNLLARLEEITGVGSFRWNPVTDRVAWSAALYHILSRTTAQFDGTFERFLSCFHPDDRVEMRRVLEHALADEQPFRTRRRIVRTDKEIRLLDFAGDVVRDENGIVTELYCICYDITEVEHAEKRLLQSEARYRLLVERMKDYAFLMLDTDGNITSWNEGAQRIKGYRAEEIIGQHISRFYTPEDIKQGLPVKLLRTAKNEGRAEHEGLLVRKDGSLFWADVIITGLWDENGDLRGFGILTRDLTEQRLAEQTLRESQERLRAIFEHSPSMIFMKDTEGRYIDCNPPFEKLCGKSRDQIIGKTDRELFPAEQAAEFIANDRAVLEQGTATKFEETALHEDGPHVSIVSKFPLRDPSGRIFGIGGIVTDITQRKQAEESLHQLSSRLLELQDEEQQRIARELQKGAVQMLEDLRTQLALLKGSGIVFDWKTSEALQKGQRLVLDATREVRTLAHLLYPTLLDEAGLLEALRSYEGGFSLRTGVKVFLDIPAKLERLPQEAERTLFRVVQESLANVHRHSGSSVARIRITRDEQTLTLEVRDEGKGVPPGILEPVSGTVAIAGVGIRGMVERMRQLGGRLEIDSAGWGTIVRATLPLQNFGSTRKE